MNYNLYDDYQLLFNFENKHSVEASFSVVKNASQGPSNPETFDTSNIQLYLMLMMISGISLFMIRRYFKKV